MAANPYEHLAPSAFWRSAVASVPAEGVAGLSGTHAFRLSRHHAVGTAGSCFAQHIGRNLAKRGYHLVDVEPAPPLLPRAQHPNFGYGLFSARYGNIYTAAQFRQLLERAYGRFEPSEQAWRKGDRWFDPLRPAIEPQGFESQDELRASVSAHLRAVKRMISQLDVMVFTLGLTEAWRSREDGLVFPMCPGTVAGEFDGGKYEFVNYDYAAVHRDLMWCINFLRRRRPALRFILTVSPVPLTATASGQHVLTATTYSKSVLRAVAGAVAASHDFVDYFPSYEIITSPVFGGRFYEANLRSVTSTGVDFVMATFFREFCDEDVDVDVRPEPEKAAPAGSSFEDEDEVVCEEAILESYA